MSMTEKIKILLIKRNTSVTELASKMGCTPQNLSGKFKRDNFSEKELIQIAEILNCEYQSSFILNDTGEHI